MERVLWITILSLVGICTLGSLLFLAAATFNVQVVRASERSRLPIRVLNLWFGLALLGFPIAALCGWFERRGIAWYVVGVYSAATVASIVVAHRSCGVRRPGAE